MEKEEEEKRPEYRGRDRIKRVTGIKGKERSGERVGVWSPIERA